MKFTFKHGSFSGDVRSVFGWVYASVLSLDARFVSAMMEDVVLSASFGWGSTKIPAKILTRCRSELQSQKIVNYIEEESQKGHIPIGSMYGLFTYIWLDFYGRCKVYIFNTWILWDFFLANLSRICIDPGVSKDVAGIFTPKIAEMFPNLTNMLFQRVETTNDSKW